MRKIREFIALNDLRPGDAIKAKKIGWEILDHYAVYVGQDDFNRHYFMANSMKDGVRYYSEDEVEELLREFAPRQIRKFHGDEAERKHAVLRATNEEGKAYNLIRYNCEHFANYVQYGQKKSGQVSLAGVSLTVLVFLIIGSSKG
ncbi:lecithin retinol acyltransferase family protein [Ekhidna sp.]|jgi:hypothetical protein|uniref:lecithin retinol acyltransferase family protein n=1 Tax=Ekhidna sp. TaxID=2608089 RepID=UPI0032EDB572